jgi:hypothetical protein
VARHVLSSELQRRLSAIDGVYFERCFVSMTARCGNTPVATIADAIGDVGIRSTVISTDLGQPDTPAPVDGFRMYAERLRASGFSVDQVRVMMQSNPRKLLGIGAGRSCAAAPQQFGT